MTQNRWSLITQGHPDSPFQLSQGYISIHVISILNYFSWSVGRQASAEPDTNSNCS